MTCTTRIANVAWLTGLLALLWLGLAILPAHAGERHYYYTDAQGTVLAKTDAQGNIIARYDYKPYGAPVPGPQTHGPTGYTGHVNDAETGLVYMQARYYDPMTGRFLSVDPVGPKPGNGFGFNRYSYGNNNPIVNIDPNGRECITQDDGSSVCDPPGDDIGSFPIPAGSNNPGYIGPESGGYHSYNAEASTPFSNQGLTKNITEAEINNPTPGNDSPATAAGTVNDAGISPFTGSLGDSVTSYVTTDSNNNTVVVNVTVPGQHILNPGYVAMAIIPGKDLTRIVVVGEGNAWTQVGPGSMLGGAVFGMKVNSDMRKAVYESSVGSGQ